MTRIRLRIDHVVLNGIDAGDPARVEAGLRAELERVLGGPLPADPSLRSHQTRTVRAGRIALEPGPAGGERLGRGVATAIIGGIKR